MASSTGKDVTDDGRVSAPRDAAPRDAAPRDATQLIAARDSPLALLRSKVTTKPGAHEEQPFGPDALVYKAGGKMFALIAWKAEPLRISLKCDPFEAEAMRDEFEAIQPGYHLNKRHWNTVILDGSVPEFLIDHLIDQSYALVLEKLPRRVRDSLSGTRG